MKLTAAGRAARRRVRLERLELYARPRAKFTYPEHEADTPAEEKLHTPFRGSAARANYLAADGIEFQYAAKEVCQSMAAAPRGSSSRPKAISDVPSAWGSGLRG